MNQFKAAELLGISARTLRRRVAAGAITCTKLGSGKFAQTDFSHADLGLPEPEPGVTGSLGDQLPYTVDSIAPAYDDPKPAPAPKSERVPDIREKGAFDPAEFRDSFGHLLTGNARHRMFETQHSAPPDLQAHMDERLTGTSPSRAIIGTDGAPVTDAGDPNHPLNKNFKPIPTITQSAPDFGAKRRDITALIFAGIRQGWSR
jgi:hypothetical protein